MKKEIFLTNKDQNDIYAYTIQNDDIILTAIDFGATITALKIKDKNGCFENIIAAFDDPKDYLECAGPYLNAIVGPVAGRIAYGEYILDDQTKHLSINNGVNHLHGGASGISKKQFQVEAIDDLDQTYLHLSLTTDHEADGYAGTFQYDIYYRLMNNTLRIDYHCIPTKKTLINMTSHLYFNLSGEMKETIKQHHLMLPSSHKLKIHEDGYPYMIEAIAHNSTFDFSTSKKIGENYAKGSDEYALTKGYDTPFLLDDGNEIQLYDETSGRTMSITTDQTSVVIYTANYFSDDMHMNSGRSAYPFCCIALETQDPPNGINIEALKTNQVFDHEHPYTQSTSYTFTITS